MMSKSADGVAPSVRDHVIGLDFPPFLESAMSMSSSSSKARGF
jgi:hypothetical protein